MDEIYEKRVKMLEAELKGRKRAAKRNKDKNKT